MSALDAGWDPVLVHAWRTTGFMLTEMNQHNLTAHDVEAWHQAAEDFRKANPDLYDEDGAFLGG